MLKDVIFQDYHFSSGYYEEGAWIHKRKTKINMFNIINTTDFVYEVRRRRIWNTEVEENNNGTSTKKSSKLQVYHSNRQFFATPAYDAWVNGNFRQHTELNQ